LMGGLVDDRGAVVTRVIGANELYKKLGWREQTAFGQLMQKRAVASTVSGVGAMVVFVQFVLAPIVGYIDGGIELFTVVWMAGGGTIVTVLLWVVFLRTRKPALLSAAKRFGYCGQCGYGLRDVAGAEDDGCVVCPECGAAWRVEGE